MAVSVNTASTSPENAVKNVRKDNSQAKTIDTTTKDMPQDSVEIKSKDESKSAQSAKSESHVKDKALAAGGAAALLIALSALVLKKKPDPVKTTAVVRVIKNNLDFKKAEAVAIFNKYLKDGEKINIETPKDIIKKIYKKLAVKYHPDTSALRGKVDVEDIFKEIGTAYSLIK